MQMHGEWQKRLTKISMHTMTKRYVPINRIKKEQQMQTCQERSCRERKSRCKSLSNQNPHSLIKEKFKQHELKLTLKQTKTTKTQGSSGTTCSRYPMTENAIVAVVVVVGRIVTFVVIHANRVDWAVKHSFREGCWTASTFEIFSLNLSRSLD